MSDAISQNFRQQRERYSWVRLFDGLRDWVRVRGMTEEDDFQLKQIEFALEWLTGPQAEGPQALVLQTFREDAELWLSACPAENVVVMPREVFARIIGALPPLTYKFQTDGKLGDDAPGLPQMSVDDWARLGADQLIRYADQRRYMRERAEREHGSSTDVSAPSELQATKRPPVA